MGKVTQSPVFKAGGLRHIDLFKFKGFFPGDNIPVPEIAAAGKFFKIVVNAVKQGPGTGACDKEQFAFAFPGAHKLVIVAAGTQFEVGNHLFNDHLMGKRIDGIGTQDNKVAFSVIFQRDRQLFSRDPGVI